MPPLQQELLGFHLAATAVAEAASRSTWQGRAVFALDCKTALHMPQVPRLGLCCSHSRLRGGSASQFRVGAFSWQAPGLGSRCRHVQ